MKKIVLLFIGLLVVSTSQVSAASFRETKHNKYQFVLSKDGVRKERDIIYVTDVNNLPYYDIMPERPFFMYRNYDKKVLDYDEELKKKISEIMYFGYRYSLHTAYNYYYATQYLLYDLLGYSSNVLNTKGENEIFFQKEIEEIKETLAQKHFLLEDFTSISRTFTIEDSYILDNYDVQGEHLEIAHLDEKIEITFLDNREDYTIHFVPKNDCSTVGYWVGVDTTGLLHMDNVCEENRLITVKNGGMPFQEESTDATENSKEEQDEANGFVIPYEEDAIDSSFSEEPYEVRDVAIPSTSKFSFAWLFLLVLLGNVYYVFKK